MGRPKTMPSELNKERSAPAIGCFTAVRHSSPVDMGSPTRQVWDHHKTLRPVQHCIRNRILRFPRNPVEHMACAAQQCCGFYLLRRMGTPD